MMKFREEEVADSRRKVYRNRGLCLVRIVYNSAQRASAQGD